MKIPQNGTTGANVNRDVKISVIGNQESDGQTSTTEHYAGGQYFERNGARYLIYVKEDKDSRDLTTYTLKFKDQILEMTQRGAVNTRMTFEAGRTHPANYVTDCGPLTLDVCTEDLKCQWRETSASVMITYKLSEKGAPLSRNQLSINFSEKD